MDIFICPPSPELTIEQLQQLAPYAQALGQARVSAQARTLTGNLLTKKKGHGLDLREVRPYTTSDEVRHIDWRVTARTGTPHTRVYTEDIEHRNFVIMHLSKDAYFGTQTTFLSTRYAQLAAVVSWRSQYQREPIGAHLQYGQQQQSFNTISNWHAWIECLADSTNMTHREGLTDSLELTDLPPLRSQSLLVLSDQIWLDEATEARLGQLATHNRVHWLSLEDPNLFALPDGAYRFVNSLSAETLTVDRNSREHAAERFKAQQQHFTQQLNRLAIADAALIRSMCLVLDTTAR